MLVLADSQVAQPPEVSEGVGREELNVVALKIATGWNVTMTTGWSWECTL